MINKNEKWKKEKLQKRKNEKQITNNKNKKQKISRRFPGDGKNEKRSRQDKTRQGKLKL